ncbi:Vps51/Vps67-domain-containing protein [Limtongia smithiae]|uniref:Vps51/Vps67-domain-containing protein n=1 Tax=Limtongia smithiae TaxID=1125753 RepID=UPI0034CE9DDF
MAQSTGAVVPSVSADMAAAGLPTTPARTVSASSALLPRPANGTPRGPNRSASGASTPTTSSTVSTARRNALREFYALGQDRYTAGVGLSELDRTDFDVDVWLDQVVRESSMAEVLRRENGLLHEMRSLDGEGKALVYDNYSKLITATETIQSMRGNMEPLQPSTSSLAPAIEHIAEMSASLSAALVTPGDRASEDTQQAAMDEHWRRAVLARALGTARVLRRLLAAGDAAGAHAEWAVVDRELASAGVEAEDAARVRGECEALLR